MAPLRLSPRRTYAILAVGIVIEAAVAACVGSVTLDDHPAWHAIGLLPLLAPFLVGFAERFWRAIFALEAATLVSFALGWSGYARCMRNTPLCQECGTCCEGGALGVMQHDRWAPRRPSPAEPSSASRPPSRRPPPAGEGKMLISASKLRSRPPPSGEVC